MIDLHMHSNYSDGTFSVIEILKEAERKNLEYISITDHDTVKAYFDLQKINTKNYFKGNIIRGCEFKCVYPKRNLPIEILGYGIDIEKIDSLEIGKTNIEIQQKYLQKIKEIGKSIGLIFDNNIKVGEGLGYASEVFEKEIIKYPENVEILNENKISLKPNFYRAEQCNKESIFYIDETKDYIKPDQIIEIIHNSGGLAFLAHPYIYPVKDTLKLVEELVEQYSLDGIECYYSLFSEKQTQDIVELCKKHKLFMSGGSDFHGLNKTDINMGIGTGNLVVNETIIQDWADKVLKN